MKKVIKRFLRDKQFHISGLFFVHEMSKFWVATYDYSNVFQTGCDSGHAEKYSRKMVKCRK